MLSAKPLGPVLVLLTATVLVSGCSGSDDYGEDGRLQVEVAMDAGLEKSAKKVLDERVKHFEKANEDIDIIPQEYTWEATTFTAQLAGDTLPDVFTAPFTDGRGLIERKQIADISALVADLPYADKFNPGIAKAGSDAKDRIWAVPVSAYGQALHYNRALFDEAGLDPDKPPTTWKEVREAAKKIADETGEAGYVQMTKDNTGGWILTTLDNALGGRVEELDGDKATSTINTPQMVEALELLRDMRWKDDSMGDNFLHDWAGSNQDFAAGRIGMYITGGGNYGQLMAQNDIKPDDYGVTVVPLSDSPDAGVLGGGTLAAVNASASEEVKAAAVKWIDFYYMEKLTDAKAAKLDAKTTAESGQAVGAPLLPVFDKKTYDKQQEWIADYINVPVDQMKPYTDNMFDQPLATEPTKSTQEVYGVMDTVVQSVLTEEDADIDKLLDTAEKEAQALLDKAAKK
ncbi:ABC transporter substrate-binding protein [Stackebrandtia nassauensis]|uniref:Extracellular solute-binding protein family 1 n=1 Tax=Stackebrandtia nassauensis (strain DSM 44728 / CIP 108903 / NRRL B-16338 / NBRC 102104 / LLR-40K-21) TaxID=446470 RepID=D3Q7J4_STANL|nr:extracellular solute-binding protein [Stackebrandtia nassauensis]ADD44336.1 extracellular solute-binding protein family 1 [Stackebrandtia nassauensis DSM 44728]